jgi:two-component system sensor histidine kinase and response regulator WspE
MDADSSQIDPAMLELFQAEMDTHIPVLNEGLLALEKGQAGAREIEGMMRAAHSIKGAARIVGIESAVRVAHAMEDCFTAAKEDRITLSSDAVDVLLVGVDALQRICSPLSESAVTDTALGEILGRLAKLMSGDPPATTPTITSRAPAAAKLVSATIQPGEPSVALPSSFSDDACEALRRELVDILALTPDRIVLDFARVEELNAGGLALLASFAREAAQIQPAPAIELRRIGPPARTVLRAAGLDEFLGARD